MSGGELAERSEVRWGATDIPYVIRRSERRGTVGIAVEPSGTVVLTAPRAASVPRLDRVVLDKAKWIVDRVKRRSSVPPARGREFVSGETFLYLGRQYRLRVLPGEDVQPIALRAGRLELPVPADLKGALGTSYARAALTDWYTRRARENLASWVTPWAEAAGAKAPKVIVTDQAKRWGSCTKEALRFNWRVVQAPRSLVDYVLAHEVVHLAHEQHNAAFWSALGRIMPDYEARKARLRTLGPELMW
jgi:predicted metal-dependent hydrolase